jgi:hypothetical protein
MAIAIITLFFNKIRSPAPNSIDFHKYPSTALLNIVYNFFHLLLLTLTGADELEITLSHVQLVYNNFLA